MSVFNFIDIWFHLFMLLGDFPALSYQYFVALTRISSLQFALVKKVKNSEKPCSKHFKTHNSGVAKMIWIFHLHNCYTVCVVNAPLVIPIYLSSASQEWTCGLNMAVYVHGTLQRVISHTIEFSIPWKFLALSFTVVTTVQVWMFYVHT